jgi:flagellin
MALRIMTNQSAINAQRHLGNSTDRLQSVLEKLASGSRINHAADDAAGLAISDGLNATIRSVGQAIRNAQDGASLVQVFEGSTNEINNMLVRLRELAMQAATDTVSDRDRSLINQEVKETVTEIERIANTTKYADRKLLDGSAPILEFQVGPNNVPEEDRIIFDPSHLKLTTDVLGIDGMEYRTKQDAQDALDTLDDGLYRVNSVRAQIGAVQTRLNSSVTTSTNYNENLSAAKSRIRDTDIALESTNLAKETMVRNAGVSVLSQANTEPAVALQLLRNG